MIISKVHFEELEVGDNVKAKAYNYGLVREDKEGLRVRIDNGQHTDELKEVMLGIKQIIDDGYKFELDDEEDFDSSKQFVAGKKRTIYNRKYVNVSALKERYEKVKKRVDKLKKLGM